MFLAIGFHTFIVIIIIVIISVSVGIFIVVASVRFWFHFIGDSTLLVVFWLLYVVIADEILTLAAFFLELSSFDHFGVYVKFYHLSHSKDFQ